MGTPPVGLSYSCVLRVPAHLPAYPLSPPPRFRCPPSFRMLALLPAPTRSPIPSASTLLPPLACRGRSCLPPSPASPRQVLHPLWPGTVSPRRHSSQWQDSPCTFAPVSPQRKPEALRSRHTRTHHPTRGPPPCLPTLAGVRPSSPAPPPAPLCGSQALIVIPLSPPPRPPRTAPPGPRRRHRRRRLPSGRGGGGAGEEAPLSLRSPGCCMTSSFRGSLLS